MRGIGQNMLEATALGDDNAVSIMARGKGRQCEPHRIRSEGVSSPQVILDTHKSTRHYPIPDRAQVSSIIGVHGMFSVRNLHHLLPPVLVLGVQLISRTGSFFTRHGYGV